MLREMVVAGAGAGAVVLASAQVGAALLGPGGDLVGVAATAAATLAALLLGRRR